MRTERSSRPLATKPLAAGLAADIAAVVIFAAAGRRSHDEAGGIAGVLTTAAPFLLALGAGWLAAAGVTAMRGRAPSALLLRPEWGVNLAVGTTTLGMLLRRSLWGRGTAVAFIAVTAMFLAAAMGGWRAVAARRRNRASENSPAEPGR